jgi:hypothetical protein
LLDCLIHGQLAIHGRDQKIADRREGRAAYAKNRENRLKLNVLGSLGTVLVVRYHLFVGIALLNREVRRDMAAAGPCHLLDKKGNELECCGDFLGRLGVLLIIRYGELGASLPRSPDFRRVLESH